MTFSSLLPARPMLPLLSGTSIALRDMSARRAPDNSSTFSWCSSMHKWLKDHPWRVIDSRVPAVTATRYLGSYLVARGPMTAPSKARRMQEAGCLAGLLDRLPLDGPTKATTIRTKVLPRVLHGCESGTVGDAAIRQFRAAVAAAVRNGGRPASTDFVFTVKSHGTDIDPLSEVFVRRVAAIRKAAAISATSAERIRTNYEFYPDRGEPGTDGHGTIDAIAAPLPGRAGRKDYKEHTNPQGPVGLLIQFVDLMGLTIDANMDIKHGDKLVISILEGPVQALKAQARKVAAYIRTTSDASKREEA